MTRRTNGFTMIEVLVSVSIIAVLIAMLLPGLTTGRRSGQFTDCISQMRQFAIAQGMYAVDNDYIVVHNNWHMDTGGWLYAEEKPGGNGWVPPQQYRNDFKKRQDMRKTGLLYDYLSESNGNVYHCPADKDPFDDSRYPVRAMTSYQFNGSFTGYQVTRIVYDTKAYDQFRPEDVFMWETDVDDARAGYWNDGANHPGELLSKRHLDGAPVARIDGSSDKMTFDDFEYYGRGQGSNRKNNLWCNPDTNNGRR